MRILIVDDSESARNIAQRALEEAGHEVATAGGGEEAWRILLDDPDWLVVTDWIMPDIDGLELTKRIRAGTFSAYVYVIIVTSLTDRESLVLALENGADDYLGKPYHPAELVARVNVGVRMRRLEQEHRESARRLRELTTLDPVTGVLNRPSGLARLREEASRAATGQHALSIALVAVPGIAAVRATAGVAAADETFRALCEMMRLDMRPYDFAARWRGEVIGPGIRWGMDELLIVFPECAPDTAMQMLERLQTDVAASLGSFGTGLAAQDSLKFGVAGFTEGHPRTPEDLVSDAMRVLEQGSSHTP